MNTRKCLVFLLGMTIAGCDSNGGSGSDATDSATGPQSDSALVDALTDGAPSDSNEGSDAAKDGATDAGKDAIADSTSIDAPSSDASITLDGGFVLKPYGSITDCASFQSECIKGCESAPAGAHVEWCKPYCANAWACCQDIPPPSGGSGTIPAIPALCRIAALWNAQGHKEGYLCPVPLASDGSCPCPAGTTKCPAYTVTSDDLNAAP